MFMLLAIDKQRKGFKPVMVLSQDPEEHAHILEMADCVFSNQKIDLAFLNALISFLTRLQALIWKGLIWIIQKWKQGRWRLKNPSGLNGK